VNWFQSVVPQHGLLCVWSANASNSQEILWLSRLIKGSQTRLHASGGEGTAVQILLQPVLPQRAAAQPSPVHINTSDPMENFWLSRPIKGCHTWSCQRQMKPLSHLAQGLYQKEGGEGTNRMSLSQDKEGIKVSWPAS
jgi:hypothetical protein